ncbi:UNVERIFIED_CONTAM: hypothetical protein FKN15_076305 [Acipenser sinensis]
MKLKFCKRQLQHVLSQLETSVKCGSEILKESSSRDVIYWINRSWNQVEAATIQKCFVKAGFLDQICETMQSQSENDHDSDNEISQEVPTLDLNVATCDTDVVDWERPVIDILRQMNSEDVEYGAGEDTTESECGDVAVCSAVKHNITEVNLTLCGPMLDQV